MPERAARTARRETWRRTIGPTSGKASGGRRHHLAPLTGPHLAHGCPGSPGAVTAHAAARGRRDDAAHDHVTDTHEVRRVKR